MKDIELTHPSLKDEWEQEPETFFISLCADGCCSRLAYWFDETIIQEKTIDKQRFLVMFDEFCKRNAKYHDIKDDAREWFLKTLLEN